ncbi:hypothetical protein [Streptomyces sp. JJ38]|uniref:hypothetical protein n=1 Tax=Streptomyces sp. JJ38 TaxID=2738128 RepID=UPI001C57F931|nr:hypothetical protein [Streptomyces sp. JJ38]MBW1599701.1 hypothetical protein [Streptomyces sp. JJ38]
MNAVVLLSLIVCAMFGLFLTHPLLGLLLTGVVIATYWAVDRFAARTTPEAERGASRR